jgi:hypothetical protein
VSVDNPFATSDTWDVSLDEYLGNGNHVVTITEAVDETAKSTGNPKLVLKLVNPNGSIQAFEGYHAGFLRKIVSIFDAAGIPRPQDGEFDPEDNCRLTPACRQRLVGKNVGIVVRPEAGQPDEQGNVKEWPRVKGYVEPSQVNADIPTDTSGMQTAAVGATPDPSDDIPF